MIEADLLRALERRVAALERELRQHQEAASTAPSLALRELKRQVDIFKNKLETTEHLSWLGFYKQLPEPISSEACRRLQYRRKSDSVKRKVREKFLNICDVTVSTSVREWLRSPAFDARQWEDEELLLMLQTMFVELDLPQKFNIPLSTLRNFLFEVYNNYNEVPFHNFRHCFCVAQMMYAIAWAVDLPSKIGYLEVFVLIVSCICHDLDHPGYNNIYQINARTELALRYNDISPLENHHCSVAFRVLEAPECNILASLNSSTFRTVREGIIRCILATDMARHNEILGQFTDVVPEFDYSNKTHINLLSMILIKVADISNEARPMDVAEPWLDSLLQEFFKQSDAEKLEGLPVTPFMDRDKVTKPSSQCSFIGLVLLPLFEALGELFPELQNLIVKPVREALEYYRRLNEAAKDERHHRKSLVDLGESSHCSTPGNGQPVVKSASSQSVRSKKSAGTQHSRSRSMDDEGENLTIEEMENIDSSDPETATEVEISEKTLKFKISTEGNLAGRKSHPGSRKGSREKTTLDYYTHDLIREIREHERERRKSRGEHFSSDMSSPVSARSADEPRILEELEKDEVVFVEARISDERPEGNGNAVPVDVLGGKKASIISIEEDMKNSRKDSIREGVRCCCDDSRDKSTANNHGKSLLTRLRNFTDRLSISFDSKEPPVPKQTKHPNSKTLNKSNSITSTSSKHTPSICKKCNLAKSNKENDVKTEVTTVRAMTLPKAKKSQDGKNKSWRTVFAKEKRPSVSLEALPAVDSQEAIVAKHRRNFSNPEGKTSPIAKNLSLREPKGMNFKEIDLRSKPEIVVDPSSSTTMIGKDIGKVEIRRSSASMEDISKITKQNEPPLLGSLDDKKTEELQHTGSLDSMLYKESLIGKKPVAFSSPGTSKKTSAGLFSRFKSGMSMDSGARSNSGSLHEPQSPGGWISSLTASFRPKRQASETPSSPHCSQSPNLEEPK
ncbi:uncharacterized protein LOC105704027 isoform X2 [Orussus abietinus]|nr:uncharacterized protein LOC105704027 isoform X2 [Orussus abietinus]